MPLDRLLADLRPGAVGPDMIWAYIMVLSTLLPTALHFLLFAASFVLRFPGRRIIAHLAHIPQGDAPRTAYVEMSASLVSLGTTLLIGIPALFFVYVMPGAGAFWGWVATLLYGFAESVVTGFGLS
jgi:hypothetical protein